MWRGKQGNVTLRPFTKGTERTWKGWKSNLKKQTQLVNSKVGWVYGFAGLVWSDLRASASLVLCQWTSWRLSGVTLFCSCCAKPNFALLLLFTLWKILHYAVKTNSILPVSVSKLKANSMERNPSIKCLGYLNCRFSHRFCSFIRIILLLNFRIKKRESLIVLRPVKAMCHSWHDGL